MYSIRKWMFRPKRTDSSALAQFFYADEELNLVAAELDSFDGRKDPERCTALVNQLRHCQDKVLTQMELIMQEVIPERRASRDFRVKFPDDVLQESLAGQLWFGAECLAAGSSIMNRELESTSMRPLARSLTRHLDYLRSLLRDQCLRDLNPYTDKIREALVLFDKLFAEFELSYVSAMVPVKTVKEYDMLQDVTILFCETVHRALCLGLLTEEMIEDCEPALMFTIPRLAIVAGLLVYPEGPVNPDMDPISMSEMFRPFQTLLYKIRELLWTLSKDELWLLERSLCTNEVSNIDTSITSIEEELSRSPSDSDELAAIMTPLDRLTSHNVLQPATAAASDANEDITHQFLEAHNYYSLMSNSPSTATIVASSSEDGVQLSPNHQSENNVRSGINNYVVKRRRESAPGSRRRGSALWQVEARRLRHARSWPPSTSGNIIGKPQSASHPTTCEIFPSDHPELISSLDILTEDTSALEEQNLVENAQRFTHSAGSQEFAFHLPRNTSAFTHTPDNTGSERTNTFPVPNIIYTSGSESAESTQVNQEVAFITDTLNQVFLTDLSFQDSVPDSNLVAVGFSNVPHSHNSAQPLNVSHLPLTSDSSHPSDANVVPFNNDYHHRGGTDRLTNEKQVVCGNSCYICSCNCRECKENHTGCNGSHTGCISNHTGCSDNHTGCIGNHTECSGNHTGCISSHTGCSGIHAKCSDSNSDCIFPSLAPPHSPTSSLYEEKSNNEPSEKELLRSSEQSQQTSGPLISDRSPKSSSPLPPPQPHATSKQQGSVLTNNQMDQHGCEKLTCSRAREVAKCRAVGPLCNSRCSSVSSVGFDWDRESYGSSDTSSYTSDCHDDEEISLAIQAAEMAARKEARARFKNSKDLIHRLFVCISGVADQLQTNYAGDLRHILKVVFECYTSHSLIPSPEPAEEATPTDEEATPTDDETLSADVEAPPINGSSEHAPQHGEGEEEHRECHQNGQVPSRRMQEDPHRTSYNEVPHTGPEWVPDDQSIHCTLCMVPFTFVRRRHHCRNCGKIFCSRCSANSVPLPHYGHCKPVRVCNHCFMFQVTPFTVHD